MHITREDLKHYGGNYVPARCATDWGNGHRCARVADHPAPHRCVCGPSEGPHVDHNDDYAMAVAMLREVDAGTVLDGISDDEAWLIDPQPPHDKTRVTEMAAELIRIGWAHLDNPPVYEPTGEGRAVLDQYDTKEDR